MTLTSNEILSSLLAHYKAQGIDMTSMLGDPVFMSQPMAERIAFLQQRAKEIAAHSSMNPALSARERPAVTGSAVAGAVAGGLTGFGGAMMLAATLPNLQAGIKASIAAGALGALGGALVGGVSPYLEAKQKAQTRISTAAILHRLAGDSSANNAVAALSSGRPPESASSYGVKALLNGSLPSPAEVGRKMMGHPFNTAYMQVGGAPQDLFPSSLAE